MTTTQEKLDALRNKWKGRVPKSNLDKNWWRFMTDKCLAVRYINELKNGINKGEEISLEIKTEEVTYEQAKAIFNS